MSLQGDHLFLYSKKNETYAEIIRDSNKWIVIDWREEELGFEKNIWTLGVIEDILLEWMLNHGFHQMTKEEEIIFELAR